jgi:hypothetical protein
MSTSVPTAALASLLLLAGCASAGAPARVAADAPAASPPSPLTSPCLPPGVADGFFAWPVRAYRPMLIRRDDDSVINAAWVLYRRGDAEVAALWGGEELLALDPSPRTTETPVWFDAGLVADNGETLRAQVTEKCRWRQSGGMTVLRQAPPPLG